MDRGPFPEILFEHLILHVSWQLSDSLRNCLPGQAHVVKIIHFLRDNPSYDLDQALFNELTIREWFTMLSNKMSYFVTRVSSIFGNVFSTMKLFCWDAKLNFNFLFRFFPFERIKRWKRAVAFVKRSVVTFKVVFFWSR